MFRTIIWFIYFWLYLIAVLPTHGKINRLAKLGKRKEYDQLVAKTVQKWARSLVRLAGVTVRTLGEENIPSGAVLFVSNHQGNFDIPILLGYIKKPKAFIAKIELQKLPLVPNWMKHMKCIFMDRGDIRQSLQAIKQASELLREGYSMVIFPEGTRSRGNSLGDFKLGSLKPALKAGVPIIPVTIRGSYKIMEQNRFIIKPALVEITISQPIPTTGLTKEEAAELPQRVREIIQNNLKS